MGKINITDISIESIKNGKFQNELSEFYELQKNFENNAWHHETTFEHVLLVLDEYEKLLKKQPINFLNVKLGDNLKVDLLRIAILLHDISKNDTIQIADDKTTSFPNHEELGALKALKILNKFELSKIEIDYIVSIIGNHRKPHEIMGDRKNCDQAFNDLKTEIPDTYNETLLLTMVDTMGSKLKQSNEEEYNFRINKYKNLLKLI